MMTIGLPQYLQTSAGLFAFITVGKKTFSSICIRRKVILALPCKNPKSLTRRKPFGNTC